MINYDLNKVRAVVFDLDGVLSAETITLGENGTPLRTVNVKDGYAIQLAVKMGLRVAIISGCKIDAVRNRYEGLGMEDVYLGVAVKIKVYDDFLAKYDMKDDEVIFMGDDIPDLEVLRRAGCPVCPKDACPEVKAACCYVSDCRGGQGCARDVLEQVLKAQGKWLSDERAFGW